MNDLFEPKDAPKEIYFVVPGEVRGKGRPRTRVVTTGSGKSFANIYTDQDTRKYETRISSHAMMAKGKAGWAVKDRGPLRLDVVAVFGIPVSWTKKKRAALDGKPAMNRIDADNVIKAIGDALNHVLFHDDKCVAIVTCTKLWTADPAHECLKIKVSEIV